MTIEEGLNYAVLELEKPLWIATEWLDSALHVNNIAYKVARVCLASIPLLVAIPFAIASRILDGFSNAYFKRESLKTAPTGSKIEGSPEKFLTFNVCMMQGILCRLFGNMDPTGQRAERVADFIKTQDADIVALQELPFTGGAANTMIELLKETYPYIFYRIGPNPFAMENSIFVASKTCPVNQIYVPFEKMEGSQKGFRRGFFVLEFADNYVITTHLDPSNPEVRKQQLEVIINYKKPLSKECVFLGDLNNELEDEAAHDVLRQNFGNFNADTGTFISDGNWRRIDHILVDREIEQIVVKTFGSEYDPPLSDHHAVVLNLRTKL